MLRDSSEDVVAAGKNYVVKMQHGTQDEKVLTDWGFGMSKVFRHLGYAISFTTSDRAHCYDENSVIDISSWLEKTLGSSEL